MKSPIKSLEIIKEMYEYFVKKCRDLEPNLMICEKEDFETIQKSLKALEIIKPCCLIADYKTDDPDTRYELAFCKKICITKEEYDLLKEILK